MENQYGCKWVENIDALEEIFRDRGWMQLNRETSKVLGFYDGDKLAGFLCVQLVPHMEPIYVDPEYRGRGIPDILVTEMAQYIKSVNARGVMIVAGHPGMERIAQHFGMERIHEPVYSKIDMGEGL
jgi:ribosomal protein S18 acetylase RimI-like enzyme